MVGWGGICEFGGRGMGRLRLEMGGCGWGVEFWVVGRVCEWGIVDIGLRLGLFVERFVEIKGEGGLRWWRSRFRG